MIMLSVDEKRVLVELLEAAYRRQRKEAADVLAYGEARFHQEVADRLCTIEDLLVKLGSSASTAEENDPVKHFLAGFRKK